MAAMLFGCGALWELESINGPGTDMTHWSNAVKICLLPVCLLPNISRSSSMSK